MRSAGRRNDQLRPVSITPGFSAYAEGSALIKLGNTWVLCNATLEDSLPRWMQQQNVPGGWITAEYAMLPRATLQRNGRETNGLSGRTQEIRRLIGRSLRAAVDLQLLGPRTLILDCDVLQADGGTRTAAVTGGYVAVALALQRLIRAGVIPAAALRQAVAAVSVGICDGVPLLDLCYTEDSRCEVDANIVMTSGGHFVEVQGTGERATFSRPQLDAVLQLAVQGIDELLALQQSVLGQEESTDAQYGSE